MMFQYYAESVREYITIAALIIYPFHILFSAKEWPL